MAASRKIVSVDSKNMRPALWKTLPKELLLLVLARLPFSDITRLRSLSKEWNRDMASVNSEINQACEEASPTMVAVYSSLAGCSRSEFLITIYDLSTHRLQHPYRLNPGNPIIRGWNNMGACDGGLACFVSAWRPSKANPLCIVVVNLLTRVKRKLPPLKYAYLTPPKMMHIEVNSETKCYRVVVVGESMKDRYTVEMYDSGARQWTKAIPRVGVIFGDAYRWNHYNFHKPFKTTCVSVYDFAEGQLKCFDEQDLSQGASVVTYALQKDCMFVLHRNTPNGEYCPAEGYCITKYRTQKNAKDWVQEKSYLCSPFEGLLGLDCTSTTLKACEGFLMACEDFSHSPGSCWLLDLSTGEWSSLPQCFDGHHYGSVMTRAFWNVVP